MAKAVPAGGRQAFPHAWRGLLRRRINLTREILYDSNLKMRSARVVVLLTLCLWMLCHSSVSANGLVSFNVNVPPGKWKAVRLKNLPKDAVVAVEVESSGRIVVALMDSNTYRHFSGTSRPLFLGQVEKRLSFSVTIPETDNYFVVLNNRSGEQPQAVKITIRATRPGAGQKKSRDNILNKEMGSSDLVMQQI